MTDGSFELFGLIIIFSAQAKQLCLSAVIGFIIGLERAFRGKPASMRTFSTICAGSCLFTILSVEAIAGQNAVPHDVTRIAAQVVTGVGFLGGGVIFKTSDRIEGITTGALVWLAAAIGMACGFDRISLVIWSCLIGVLVHILSSLSYYFFSVRGGINGKKPVEEA